MKFHLVLLLLSVLLAVVLSQDSSEESPIPKKTLRKYRVRRPITAQVVQQEQEDSGTPRPAGPARVRRIRIKQQRPTEAPQVLQQQQYEQPQEQPVRYIQSTPAPQNLRQVVYSQPQRTEQVLYEEPQVVEQVRNVPQYRTATPSGTRTALLANVNLRDQGRLRGADDEEKKSVGTTRNYSHLNEDGSFTFGYEGEDGSFKEETRGTDCVVRGKYGYVDPDGVRREFSYVSGNPCDPNDPNKDDDVEDEEADERAAPPSRPLLRRVRPEITQNVLQGLEQTLEEKAPEDQIPVYRVSPRPRQRQPDQPTTFRPRVRVTSTQAPQLAQQQPSQEPQVIQPFIYSTPRPRPIQARPVQEVENSLPQGRSLFNFQSEVQRLNQEAVNAQPQQPYQPQVFHQTHAFPTRQVFPAPTQAPRSRPSEFRASTPVRVTPTAAPVKVNQAAATIAQEDQSTERPNYGNYRTELVFDPNTNQYTSVLVQDVPNTNEEVTLTQRLRAFVEPQRPNQYQIQQFGQPTVQYFGNSPHLLEQARQQQNQQNQQHLQLAHQQQQNQLELQQQQHHQQQQLHQQHRQQTQQQQQHQLHAQQQAGFLPVRSLQQQSQSQQQLSSVPQLHAEAQQIQRSAINSQGSSGQIDAFLRSLNISA